MQTERLLLRMPNESDVERLFEIFGDPRTNTYNPAAAYANLDKARSSISARIAHWRRHGFGQWVISTVTEPHHVIGHGGLSYRRYGDDEKLNLGYRFCVESWGHGYATELGRAALDVAFRDLQRQEVFAIVRPANKPSIRVLEKLDMALHGDLDGIPGEERSLIYRVPTHYPMG
jgi:[ribosomal protein S5]-alanine N-acetyltransferase